MAECEHDFQFEGEEILTQLENLIRLTKKVRCVKCGEEGMDVFVYIGTYPLDKELFIKEEALNEV